MFEKKSLFLIVFGIAFFVVSLGMKGALRAEAAGEIYCSTSWAPADPCISNAEDCVVCSGFVSTCTVNAPNFNQFTVLVNNFTSCSSGIDYCQTASCPNDNASFSEGDLCTVRILDDATVVASSNSHWDKSEGVCVECLGSKQFAVCGKSAGLYLSTLGSCTGVSIGNNKLDNACDAGVVPQCDEKAVGDACSPPVGGTCSATGLCIIAPSALSLTVSANPSAIEVNGTSTITFLVTKEGNPVESATVEDITVTGGFVDATSCVTDVNGECAVIYTAPAVAGLYGVNAAKATKAGETDSGPAGVVITVSSLPIAPCGPESGVLCNPVDNASNFYDVIFIAIRYLLSLIALITLLFIVISGIKYLTSFGNEEKMRSAKGGLASAVFGLVLVLMAYAILEVIIKILSS